MAGIGFELKRVLKKGTLGSMLHTYTLSAMLSSGPWVISMIVVMLIGMVSAAISGAGGSQSGQFQSIVTYVMMLASSLVFSSFFQLPFTRFVADRIFEKREDLILPNFFGLLTVISAVGILFAIPFSLWLFDSQSNLFLVLFIATFLTLNSVWIANILATSLRFFRITIFAYLGSYLLVFVLALLLEPYGKEGLLGAFLAGNLLLLFILVMAIIYHYPSPWLLRFDFFRKKGFYWYLGMASLFYNLGIWIDKLIFWYHPLTGFAVIDRLHASVVYDLPIFLAYLAIIPGMAVFFYRLEADFSEDYDNYYNLIRQEGTLGNIRRNRYRMIGTIRLALREILIIQGIFNLILFLFSGRIFEMLHLPQLYLPLFYIDLVGTQLQLGFMSVLAILFYLDRQREAMVLSVLFFLMNAGGTLLSIQAGPYFFGYGFALSLLVVFLIGLYWLRYVMERLEYETFMLQ
ncbi:MAG: hypothetical protein B6D59_00735 [Campylobacteraceae bacterium 4484_4]|nr:MAG: hypothetical protein B6D59_00735 [Campylobacteraceae bacterium 4484_4]